MVSYVKHGDINKLKWDDCIQHASNSLIYGCSFYLDAITGQWDAIVVNDYEAVMPLVWRRKYFTTYLYQPPFTQQLGIFFKEPLSKTIFQEIEAVLFAHFKFTEIFLNYACANYFSPKHCSTKVNYVLDINKPYIDIAENYLPSFTKSQRRIVKFNFGYTKPDNIDAVISLYKKLYGNRVAHLKKDDYTAFKNVCFILQQQQQLIIREATDKNGNLLATTLMFKDSKRLYNIISCITKEGKQMEANYFLYDSIIQEFCNCGLMFDLEGSDIKGVADFYVKMNPVNEPYAFYRYNNLHPLLRLIKNNY